MADEKKYYAWTTIKTSDGTIKAGTEVSRQSVKTTKVHWDEMIEGGSIRTTPWPKDLNPSNSNALSPNEHRLASLRKEREKLEAEMAGIGGAQHQLSNTEPSDTITEDDYEVNEDGSPKLDEKGDPIRKQVAA